MKTDGLPARCALGDALPAALCGCGGDIRMILADLGTLRTTILAMRLTACEPIAAPQARDLAPGRGVRTLHAP